MIGLPKMGTWIAGFEGRFPDGSFAAARGQCLLTGNRSSNMGLKLSQTSTVKTYRPQNKNAYDPFVKP